jgi:hypothetical protein
MVPLEVYLTKRMAGNKNSKLGLGYCKHHSLPFSRSLLHVCQKKY